MSKRINVLVVDDHPSVRAGLRAMINAYPDMRAVGEADDALSAQAQVRRCGPDVVVLDYKLGDDSGIELCRHLKGKLLPPKVVLYSAFADALAVPALVAGADALIDKGASPRELAAAIRAVHEGTQTVPEVTPDELGLAADLLAIDDLPILGMLVSGASARDVAETLAVTPDELDNRIGRILGVLA